VDASAILQFSATGTREHGWHASLRKLETRREKNGRTRRCSSVYTCTSSLHCVQIGSHGCRNSRHNVTHHLVNREERSVARQLSGIDFIASVRTLLPRLLAFYFSPPPPASKGGYVKRYELIPCSSSASTISHSFHRTRVPKQPRFKVMGNDREAVSPINVSFVPVANKSQTSGEINLYA